MVFLVMIGTVIVAIGWGLFMWYIPGRRAERELKAITSLAEEASERQKRQEAAEQGKGKAWRGKAWRGNAWQGNLDHKQKKDRDKGTSVGSA